MGSERRAGTHWSRAIGIRVTVVAALFVIAGCGPESLKAHPQTVKFCGKVLDTSLSGLEVYDIPGRYTSAAAVGEIGVKVGRCGVGADVKVTPSGLVCASSAVRTKNGKIVAVTLNGLVAGVGKVEAFNGGKRLGQLDITTFPTPGAPVCMAPSQSLAT
jgi:hypothetical protein